MYAADQDRTVVASTRTPEDTITRLQFRKPGHTPNYLRGGVHSVDLMLSMAGDLYAVGDHDYLFQIPNPLDAIRSA